MSDIKRTIHIEIPAEASFVGDASFVEVIEGFAQAVTRNLDWEPNIYTHTGACEESDHCAGPGSNVEAAILARAALSQDEPEYEYAIRNADGRIEPVSSKPFGERLLQVTDRSTNKRLREGSVLVRREVGPWKPDGE